MCELIKSPLSNSSYYFTRSIPCKREGNDSGTIEKTTKIYSEVEEYWKGCIENEEAIIQPVHHCMFIVSSYITLLFGLCGIVDSSVFVIEVGRNKPQLPH